MGTRCFADDRPSGLAVRLAARQDTQHDQCACLAVDAEAHAPGADAKAILGRRDIRQEHDVPALRLDEGVQRRRDALARRRIEPLGLAQRARGPVDPQGRSPDAEDSLGFFVRDQLAAVRLRAGLGEAAVAVVVVGLVVERCVRERIGGRRGGAERFENTFGGRHIRVRQLVDQDVKAVAGTHDEGW